MQIKKTKFSDAVIFSPEVIRDDRGFFFESYSHRKMSQTGVDCGFVQDNHSRSLAKGTLRGLHFQKPPYAQAKLVRCVAGAIYDVIVDLRPDSPTRGEWQSFELSAENFLMLYVPQGFAHGFCTTRENTEVLYKTDNYYHPDADAGIIWSDPDLAITWPTATPILSEKDQKLPTFKELRG